MTLTLDADVHAKLKSIAEADIRGIANEVEWLVDQELGRRGIRPEAEQAG